jgi:hypothetical protein
MTKLLCNKCGKIVWLDNLDASSLIKQINIHHNFKVRFNYGSKYDTLKGEITICEPCLLTWMIGFAVPVQLEEYEI